MTFSIRPAFFAAISALAIAILAIITASVRDCGGLGGDVLGAALFAAYLFRYLIVLFVAAAFFLGGWKAIAENLPRLVLGFLIIAVVCAALFTPYHGGCTPI